MNSTKRSAFIQVALALILFYSVYSVCFFFYQAAAGRAAFNARRTELLIDHMHLATLYIRANDTKNMQNYLNDRIKYHDLDFYMLGKDSSYVQVNMADAPFEAFIGLAPNSLNHIESGTKYDKLEVIRLEEAGTTLIIGNYLGPKNYFKILFSENQKSILGDIGFVFLSILGIVLFYFRDISQIYRALLKRDRSGIKNIAGSSAESELFLGALGGYEKVIKSSTEKNISLGRQVLSGLQVELNSGKAPPYSFPVVMARTDINRFSTIFNRFPREVFMGQVNSFFQQATAIIDRYDGLIHEYAGDEVIYYFKESKDCEAHLLAVAAIREINALAEDFSARTQAENGYMFTVKSSIAAGELRFGKLVNAYSVAGAPFIETVRILSEISVKDENSIYFSAESAEHLKKISELSFERVVTLKGYDHETNLFSFQKMKRISFLQEQLHLLRYRRSEGELQDIFSWLLAKGEQISTQDFMTVLKALAFCRSDSSWARVRDLYVELLSKYAGFEMKEDFAHRLSAILSLAKNFVTVADFSILHPILEKCLTNSDSRVVANTVDMLAQYDSKQKIGKMSFAEDHRVSASLLAKEGMSTLSDSVIKKIVKLVHSDRPVQVASALFAVGEIAKHYRVHDPVYLSTRRVFLKILEQLPEFALKKDAMISRQALIAVKKYADSEQLELMQKRYQEITDQELRSRFADIFGWKAAADSSPSEPLKKAA